MPKHGSANDYHHNHYVPEWYQRRFLLPGQTRFWYLDTKPDIVRSGSTSYTRRALLNWGPGKCFAQNDLYTTTFGNAPNTDIERFFFGRLDTAGGPAVEFFSTYRHGDIDQAAFLTLLEYMSAQKLRTPKGLAHLRSLTNFSNQNLILLALQRLQNIYSAIWTECVWQVASAEQSPTKFIISDHPVTVYNRACYPMSEWCRDFRDPDVRWVGTHTYFPLSINKVLILTNLAWVRNPYQRETLARPNPTLFREAIFDFRKIQIDRQLTEEEVIEVNYITKRRAYRYVAGAEKEWLFPERRLTSDHWKKLGDGYLLMPEPRGIHMGGQIYFGRNDGSATGFSEYGHRPGQAGFEDRQRQRREGQALERFKAEWAARWGPAYRGVSSIFAFPGGRPISRDSEEIHRHYLQLDEEYNNRPGERKRRRSLLRGR